MSAPSLLAAEVSGCWGSQGIVGVSWEGKCFGAQQRLPGSEFQHCDRKALKVGGMHSLLAAILTITSNLQGAP